MATLDFAISFPVVRGDSVGLGRFHSQPNRGSDLRPRRRAFEKRASAADGTQRHQAAAHVRVNATRSFQSKVKRGETLPRSLLHSAYENVFR